MSQLFQVPLEMGGIYALTVKIDSNINEAGPDSTVGSLSRLVFGSLQVQFLGPAHSLTSFYLLVKG